MKRITILNDSEVDMKFMKIHIEKWIKFFHETFLERFGQGVIPIIPSIRTIFIKRAIVQDTSLSKYFVIVSLYFHWSFFQFDGLQNKM